MHGASTAQRRIFVEAQTRSKPKRSGCGEAWHSSRRTGCRFVL
jgi:hypothetical protein